MTRIYAVGDIHGHIEKLEQVLSLIDADGGADARVVFLGDYIDRGPDSAAVLQRLVQGQADGRDWICLKGNHDRLMEWFLEDPPRHDPHLLVGYHWLHERIGGRETLRSYGLCDLDDRRMFELATDARAAVPESHRRFLEGLKIWHEEPGLMFVHAGVQYGVPIEKQDEDDLLWIRGPFHRETRAHPWLVVHGHTPVSQALHYGNRVNLDSGAAFGRPLTAAVFENGAVFRLDPEAGRVPLVP